jgi:hypothetical protein
VELIVWRILVADDRPNQMSRRTRAVQTSEG